MSVLPAASGIVEGASEKKRNFAGEKPLPTPVPGTSLVFEQTGHRILSESRLFGLVMVPPVEAP